MRLPIHSSGKPFSVTKRDCMRRNIAQRVWVLSKAQSIGVAIARSPRKLMVTCSAGETRLSSYLPDPTESNGILQNLTKSDGKKKMRPEETNLRRDDRDNFLGSPEAGMICQKRTASLGFTSWR